MLDSSRLLPLARHLPVLFDGAGLHRAALRELSRQRWAAADVLFEAAVQRYRFTLQVEPLARLRVHQLIGRIRCGRVQERDRSSMVLEVDRRLCRLDRIEALEPPFRLVDARALLASWLPAGATAARRAA